MTRNPLFRLAAAIALAALLACNQLLDVNATDRVPAELIDDPAQASLMVNSAVGDFECGIGSFVVVEAIISDEFSDAQLGAAAWPYDRRDANTQPGGIYGTNPCTSNQNPGVYTPMSTARWSADHALTNLQAPIDQPAMFALAEDRFTTAIGEATTAGLASVVNAGLVGRARVRLFRGDLPGAAADAQLVPAGFELDASASSDDNRRFNRVNAVTTFFGFYTVDTMSRRLRVGPTVFVPGGDSTGFVLDPRSKADSTPTRAADGVQKIYQPAKYPSRDTPIPIAHYEEAQLIVAEVQGGANAVTIINALRDAQSLPHYTGPTDAASITL